DIMTESAANVKSRPEALPVVSENIPDTLTALCQWVVWGYVEEVDLETNEVDWDKPPKRASDLGPAKSTDPKTWATFQEALGSYRRHDLDGIGLALSSPDGDGDRLVGVDLDHCRDVSTGVIQEWAWEVVKSLNTYTEVSPSGEGLRLFLYGR